VESDPGHKNYKALQSNLEVLKKATLENGRSPKIITLPMPKDIVFDTLVLPASYANFLILDHCVLVPTFNDPSDRIALNTLASCFPDREVIGIAAIDLIWGFGTLHCLSQQIPL
jgi:agmatine deiminase